MSLYRFMIAFFAWLLISTQPVFAQALPNPIPEPERVTRAISGTLQLGMQRRGFAANDHRFMNTVARVGPKLSSAAIGGTAAAVTLGAVTAPAWATVAIVAGIGTVVTYAVSLGIDALVDWWFRDDGLIDQSSAENSAYPSHAFNAGDRVWTYKDWQGEWHYGANADALAREYRYTDMKRLGYTDISEPTCFADGTTNYWCGNYKVSLSGTAPVSCGAGMQAIGSNCASFSYPLPSSFPDMDGLTAQQAISNLSDEELNKPLNPVLVAALANLAWQQAAQDPDYDGLPYPQADPITKAEASTWTQANPEFTPTVRDFVAPNPTTNSVSNPWSLPSNPIAPDFNPATPNTGTTNPATDQPLQNLGPDPGIGAPTLEAIPTAQQIMQPILDLMSDFRGYTPSPHAGECPRPTIELYGTHVLDAHCILIDDNKAIIQAAMLLAWALIALFIILSA
ncbi:hypothetical protein ACLPHM_05680 [Paenalcaligenes sp. Me131]|uniref:hypothetical protein n=1 Tax=Paenalcaligenes sp. Me131 TaxID=3392636 RepID=UPI003D2AFA26